MHVGGPGRPYLRRDGERSAFVALNFASRPATVRLPKAAPGRSWRISLTTHDRNVSEPLTAPVILAPLEALIAYD